jgi:hypothetical protein
MTGLLVMNSKREEVTPQFSASGPTPFVAAPHQSGQTHQILVGQSWNNLLADSALQMIDGNEELES